jgi:hypothetical protein
MRWACRPATPDRPAPVLDHQCQALETEREHEPLDDLGMRRGREVVAGRRFGEAEAGIVQRDAAEPVAQPLDDVAVQERPGRVAVQQEERRAGAFVDVVDLRADDVDVVALEGEEPLEQPRRSLDADGDFGRHYASRLRSCADAKSIAATVMMISRMITLAC